MDLSSFFKLLLRHKYTLIIVPVVTIVITFFLVRNQPDSYLSESEIATGIVDQTRSINSDGTAPQESVVAQEFNNLITMLRSKKVLNQLSYQLMIHDLTNRNNPYRKPSKLLTLLNTDARDHAIKVYTEMYTKMQALSLFNQDQNGLNSLMGSMGYDDQSLLKKLSIYRDNNSDYIYISFESENPELSAYVVNTLSQEFIKYYTFLVKTNQRRSVAFYANLLQVKQDTLNARTNALRNYRIKNRVLNPSEQAKVLYGQISDFETRREEAEKEAVSNRSAASKIDDKFDPRDRRYAESAMIVVNQKIINTRSQLQTLNNEYVESGFDPSYQPRIDSLQRILTRLISQASDKYSVNPMTTKQALVQQKATLEVQGDIAKSSIGPVENELRRLDNKLNELVPHEAVVQSFESGIQIAKDEYMEILAKYNQTRLESNFVTKLQQIQVAMPGVAQPSKKMLLVILSGIISFVFCLVVLFLLMFFDDSLKTPRELANATKSPVLGHLYKLSGNTIDLKQVWEGHANQDEQAFKGLMQSIRFEVGNDLKDDKVLVVNSLTPSAGKTFVALNLAYAYAQINKKVLLIDGNFKQPDITNAVNPKIFIEDYLSGIVYEKSLYAHQKVVVAGNRGSEISPLQSETEQDLRTKFDQLKAYYDVIIIETAALSNLNKAKEWIAYADKILTVFKAGKSLKENDKLNIEYLKKQPDKFIGWVLNEVSKQQVATAK